MKLILKRPISFLDTSSASGLSGIRRLFEPGEYEIDIVDSPHTSCIGKWIVIRGTQWGLSLIFLKQFEHLGENRLMEIVDDNKKDFIGVKK